MSIFILGNGKMATAIGKGLINSKKQVTYVVRNTKKAKELGLNCIHYDEFNPDGKDCILCFKPYNLEEISKYFYKKTANILISPLAGVDLAKLKSFIKAKHIVKIMPNIAAEYNKSCTTFICDKENALYNEALDLLKSFGTAIECESEEELNLAMAINGCGPALLALVAEAITNGAVSAGIKNEKAHQLTKDLFNSFASLLDNSHPAMIKEGVCSPAGVSIKGVNVLEENATRSAFIKAILACSKV